MKFNIDNLPKIFPLKLYEMNLYVRIAYKYVFDI